MLNILLIHAFPWILMRFLIGMETLEYHFTVRNMGLRHDVGESWGMANNGKWRTVQYLVEGVKVMKCFHPRMLTSLWQE